MKRIIKLWYFRLRLIFRKVTISSGCNIALKSELGGCNVIGRNTIFGGRLGFGSYIGENCFIEGLIGRYCSIASDVKVLSGTHPLSGFVSTSPVFYSIQKQSNLTFVKKQVFEEMLYADKERKYSVIIGNDVWIGTGAIIKGGVTIGNGAVILANATVTKDVPPYSIVAGTPAQILKTRVDQETADFLEDFKWWDKPVEWLKENVGWFSDINKFKEKFSR